jgi:hypothetical protein
MKKLIPILSLVAGLCLLAQSCVKDGDLDFSNIRLSDNFRYDLALPLAESSFTLAGLLNMPKDFVRPHPDSNDGLQWLFYNMSFDYDLADLEIEIPNQHIDQSIHNIPIPTRVRYTLPGTDNPIILVVPDLETVQIPAGTLPIELQLDRDFHIDSLIAETMKFRLRINSDMKANLILITENVMKPDGLPLIIPIDLRTRNSIDTIIDLAGGRFILDNTQTINFSYSGTIHVDTLREPIDISFADLSNLETITGRFPTGSFSIAGDFTDIKIDKAFGYFGTIPFEIPENTLDIPIFERFPLEELEIEKAYMTLTVTNDLGIPVSMSAHISTLTRNENGVEGASSDPINFDNLLLGFPQKPGDDPAVTVEYKEIQQLINIEGGYLPYQIKYKADIKTNPSEDPTTFNFVTNKSGIKVDIGAEIPLRLRVKRLELIDTIRFRGLPFPDGIEEVIFKMHLHNGFPLTTEVSVELWNKDKKPIDTILAPSGLPFRIEGGEIHPSTDPTNPMYGRVVKPAYSPIEIKLTAEQIESLTNARWIVIRGFLSTSEEDEGKLIGIYENSDTEGFLSVKIGCRIKANGELLNDWLGDLD